MPDTKITGLAAVVAPARTLVLPAVDTADTTMAPSGTDKQLTIAQLLSTLLASDLPVWDAANGTLLLVPAADPASPTQGDVWLSATTGGLAVCRAAGLVARQGGPIFSCGPGTAIANSTAPASLFAGATPHFGSLTIPAGALQAGSLLKLDLLTRMTTGSAPQLYVKVWLGGTVVLEGNNTMQSSWAGAGTLLSFELKVLAAGPSGSAEGMFYLMHETSLASNGFAVIGYTPTLGTPVAIATTAALAFDVQVQWGTASPSNTYQLLDATLSLY